MIARDEIEAAKAYDLSPGSCEALDVDEGALRVRAAEYAANVCRGNPRADGPDVAAAFTVGFLSGVAAAREAGFS